MPVEADAIGIEYKIDLAKLSASIKAAEAKLETFNQKIASMGQKTSAKMNAAATSVRNVSSASNIASEGLKRMGISATTTAAEIKAMNLSAVDTSAALKLTRDRMSELTNQTAKTGISTKATRKEFRTLEERMPGLQHEANKGVKAFGDYRRAMDRWGQGFKFMMLSQAAWIASGAVLFGTLTATGSAIKNFIDFHQDLRDAAAIVQATSDGYEKMEKAAVKAFLNSTLSLKESTNALKILGQTGLEASESAIVLETVYKITTATGGDMTTVVKFLTTALNVWKLEASDAAAVGNVLGAALNYSKLEVEDLGTTFNYVASLAKSVGMSITDLAATMAVMSNAGIKASTIGTGLRGVFTKLLAPTPKFRKELEKVGLTLDDVNVRTKNFFVVLKNLETAGFDIGNVFKGMTRREAAALNVLLEQGTERMNLMREALTDTDAVSVMFGRSMKGMKNQIILAGHAIQQYMIDRLNFLRPIITGTAILIRELFVSLGELNKVLLVVGSVLLVYKLNTLAAAASTSIFVAAVKALTAAFMFMKTHWIIAGLTGLVIAYTAVRMAVSALTDSLDKQLAKSSETVDAMRKLQILVQDSNKTDEERLRIFEKFAQDYPQLLDFLDEHKSRMEGITAAAQGVIDVEKNLGRVTKLRALAQQEADLIRFQSYAAFREKQKEEQKQGGLIQDFLGWAITDPALKKYRSQIEVLRDSIKLLKTDLGITAMPGVEGGATGDVGKSSVVKWTKEQDAALEKLRQNARTDREKAEKELADGLDKFKLSLDMEGSLLENSLEARYLLRQAYNEKIKKINDDEQKELDRITAKEKSRLEKESADREKILKKELTRIAKSVSEREKAEESAIKKTLSLRQMVADFENRLSDAKGQLIKDDYERELFFLNKSIEDRKRKYNELLTILKKFYEELSKMADESESPIFAMKAEEVKKSIDAMEKMIGELDKVAGGERTAMEAEKTEKDLEEKYQKWIDMTSETASAMSDSMSDLFFDAMKGELKDLSDYWQAFTTAIKRQIADMAAAWITSGMFGSKDKGTTGLLGTVIGAVGSLFNTGPVDYTHDGGPIKKMHSGGPNLKSNETLRVLEENEFVIKDSSARSLGADVLNFMNRTGRVPSGGANITNVNHSYTIVAMDSESMDQALRRGGARAIQDISIGSYAYERERRNPVFGRG